MHNKSWILHLIDSMTRYSVACIIKMKKHEKIIEKIYSKWITYFGAPYKFLSDNGGEFSNKSYRQINEELNVLTITTAAESPFSNRMVERPNLILGETFIKTLQDEKYKPEVALT